MIMCLAALSVRIVDGDNTVNENEETVRICVERIGESAEDIIVTIRSVERSPASAESKSTIYSNVNFVDRPTCLPFRWYGLHYYFC